jgi:hypothetical protein
MINALPLLLLAAAPLPVQGHDAVQRNVRTQVVATVVILKAEIISATVPKDGTYRRDRQYRTRRGVPTVEFY